MSARGRGGFTLVEVMLALTIGAMALAVLGEMIGSGITAGRSLERKRARLDSAAVAVAWLRMAFRNAEAGQPGDIPFEGERTGVRFSARMPGPNGRHSLDVVHVAFEDSGVVMHSDQLGSLRLLSGVPALRFDYLERLGAESPWLPSYQSPATPALAVRMRITYSDRADTVLFQTGVVN
ncbi:MAG TPA: prepilin-type N-terminal cleavage/methylation domain-containing protein [Gemmatimonadales bacterium]|nr:prepilin-type N-terminal cleavage/methylation domain-containing protein [Gemmatimonadales bacterium]